MTAGFLTFLATFFLLIGLALIFTPLPAWLHWCGVGFCVLSIYCGWRR